MNYPEGVSMPFLDYAPDYVECDECGEEVGANEVSTIEGRTICDGCNPKTLAGCVARDYGLRVDGGRI